MVAIMHRHFHCADFLIDAGAKLNEQINPTLDVALLAYNNGAIDILEYLESRGAEPPVYTSEMGFPLAQAIRDLKKPTKKPQSPQDKSPQTLGGEQEEKIRNPFNTKDILNRLKK
mmetsp:Transcript_41122/g.39634  ORF Transcript_41122/g.39634 Transcript_41122/m.39634 type:complete len:115 (+) Transcript_41122:323-667(+)